VRAEVMTGGRATRGGFFAGNAMAVKRRLLTLPMRLEKTGVADAQV
jgi:hypothetical protein